TIAEHFAVHTGNLARVLGKHITDMTEANKPKRFDKETTSKKMYGLVVMLRFCRAKRSSEVAPMPQDQPSIEIFLPLALRAGAPTRSNSFGT
uniref:hypothetical protein n=1 Tax=Gemmiger formicilis TaxID=745368 RepID=UPI003FF0C657